MMTAMMTAIESPMPRQACPTLYEGRDDGVERAELAACGAIDLLWS